MKVVMDFVPNFTGKDHPWFQASVSAMSSDDSLWFQYVWEDCGNGTSLPTNWVSTFQTLQETIENRVPYVVIASRIP